MSVNEPAQRLRAILEPMTRMRREDILDGLREALAAERKATVERIRAALMNNDAGRDSSWIWELLDAEAER